MKPAKSDPRFEALLDYLKRTRGFDFTGYKRSTLVRRVAKRMQSVDAQDYTAYLDYLEVHPQEFGHLFNTILINVTSFFRDKESWQFLADRVIPDIVKNFNNNHIRIWSAGCASGQEAYSIAMLFCQELGEHRFQECVKIYATDIDDEELMLARHASYDSRQLEGVPPEFVNRYFLQSGKNHVFRPDLRRCIIFGRHDLVQDAPISKLDLLVCRNTLMYLNAETQAKILARWHFALKNEGYLFLGRAETLLSHSNLFEPIDLQHRVFRKLNKINIRDRLLVLAQAGENGTSASFPQYIRLKEASIEKGCTAQFVIDGEGSLVLANEQARSLFNISINDIGRPFRDLEISYRPVELRSAIAEALAEKRTIKIGRVIRELADRTEVFEVQIVPLWLNGDDQLGSSVSFEDITDFYALYEHLSATHEELETTNEELQSTNEELETTNEELQSTNEELETTNEELQSSNEELETTNAELQSTNEELEATSTELKVLMDELQDTNSFLQSILASMTKSVVVIDHEGKILVWNEMSEELWGLRQSEVLGADFFALDIGLPVMVIKEERERKGHRSPIELSMPAVNRRGKHIHVSVKITPFMNHSCADGSQLLLIEEEITTSKDSNRK